jgi:hypothetical protein
MVVVENALTGDEWIGCEIARFLNEPNALNRIMAEREMVERDIRCWRLDACGLDYLKRYRTALATAVSAIGRGRNYGAEAQEI